MPNNRTLPTLNAGLTYGAPITALRTNLQIGDVFRIPGTKACAGFDGKIVQIKRTMFVYEYTYFDKPGNATCHIYRLINGFIKRGDVVHPVVAL